MKVWALADGAQAHQATINVLPALAVFPVGSVKLVVVVLCAAPTVPPHSCQKLNAKCCHDMMQHNIF